MEVEYSHGLIDSPDIYNQSIEELLGGTKSDCRPSSKEFESYGEGIACNDFFMGKVNTNHVKEIIVESLNSYVLTIPIKGEFSVKTSDTVSSNLIGKTGTLSFPTEKITYKSSADFITDYEVFLSPDIINPILESKFNIKKIDSKLLTLDVRTDKVKAIIQFIESSMSMLNSFEDAQKSLSFKKNLQEVVSFMVVDLIGEKTKVKRLTNNNPEFSLVRLAEEFIDSSCETIFSIQQIADKLFTTPRNIQLAFKKHRSYSPMQFLKLQKLHKAHDNIIKSNNHRLSIKEVALGVGLFDLNRFSKYYFELFGELPSHTLKRTFDK
jgi:AraC-like DNA-binding protein